jgi:hypothetical protein
MGEVGLVAPTERYSIEVGSVQIGKLLKVQSLSMRPTSDSGVDLPTTALPQRLTTNSIRWEDVSTWALKIVPRKDDRVFLLGCSESESGVVTIVIDSVTPTLGNVVLRGSPGCRVILQVNGGGHLQASTVTIENGILRLQGGGVTTTEFHLFEPSLLQGSGFINAAKSIIEGTIAPGVPPGWLELMILVFQEITIFLINTLFSVAHARISGSVKWPLWEPSNLRVDQLRLLLLPC